jgi:RNA polymerase-interacting CarD/CdnL/TRCF family regulator
MEPVQKTIYKVGDSVSYGLHGKCVILAIETKDLESGPVSFYQIRAIKNPIAAKNPMRVSKSEPHILVPMDTAHKTGLRALMRKEEAENVLKLLSEPDYHYEMDLPWVSKQKMLEEVIRKEGPTGLAKVVGHLYVLIKRDAVPPTPVLRFYESVYRILSRELAEVLGIASKEMETLLNRTLKIKLSADN